MSCPAILSDRSLAYSIKLVRVMYFNWVRNNAIFMNENLLWSPLNPHLLRYIKRNAHMKCTLTNVFANEKKAFHIYPQTFTIHSVFSLMMLSPRTICGVLYKRTEIFTCLHLLVACGNSCAVASRLQSRLNNTHRLATPSPLQPTNPERVRVSRAHKALTGRQVSIRGKLRWD